jgi:hypothetical protein
MKTPVMLFGLAAVFAAGIACANIFGSSSRSSDPAAVPAASGPCAGLTGQAKADCEKNAQR